ncbi:hypothetical protein HJA90_09520 [Rhizobium bangladeshense]|uniref:hypothetical protein n=1 Tax=Rhizobium bangladeshense TaxID=1138189 RepID=UPI001C83F394|nr:hypothetical protein [Rhizobium bangladeshense]MBX4883827.1 hypothetical protein [Rhizobium bangladeshense]
MSNRILVDGEEIFIERWRYHTDKEFEFVGEILGWLGDDGSTVPSVEDRLKATYLVRRSNGCVVESTPLSHTGFQTVTLQGALTLGFTTSEYQAGLRRQMLAVEYLTSEEELAAELLPPKDGWESLLREGSDDRNEWDPLRRVPYPTEAHFERYEVIGWVDETLPEGSAMPADRLQAEFRLQDNLTGKTFGSGHHLAEIGLESLSIQDALILGFSTLEYHEALRARLLERRHLVDEADLNESRKPPPDVQSILEQEGRKCTHELDDVFRLYKRDPAREARSNPDQKEQLWIWLTRRERPHPKRVSQQDPFEQGIFGSARKR